MKICNACKIPKSEFEFNKKKEAKDGLRGDCKECERAWSKRWRENNLERSSRVNKEWRINNPERYLWGLAQARAKRNDILFTIQPSDIVIPEFCPILGIKLETGHRGFFENSPSLDRIHPEFGYVIGNIMVMSLRANRIKSNATPDEIRKIAEWFNKFDGGSSNR
jgi:hypothetical protein